MSPRIESNVGPPRVPSQPPASSSRRRDRWYRDSSWFVTRIDRWGRSILVFCSGLFLAGSLTPWGRPQIGPFLFHPYLLALGLMTVFGGLKKFFGLEHRLQLLLSVFLALYIALCFQGGFNLSEPVKMFITIFTIWAFAVLLRNRSEVVLASVGASIGMAAISLPTILFPKSDLTGYGGSLSGGFGNKNTFSLYALPMILLGVHFALDDQVSPTVRWIFGIGAGLASIGILSGGNRSGYLGLAVIIALVALRQRKPREIAALTIGGSVVFLLLATVGSSKAFWFRLSDPATSRASDAIRVDIVGQAMSIGWHNPLLGVGPPNVSNAIATSVGYALQKNVSGGLDAHNLYAYMFAGGGFPLVILLGILLIALMARPSSWRSTGTPSKSAASAMALMQSMVILFAIRAWFSEDALTTPGFPTAFGIILALVAVESRLAHREKSSGVPDGTPDASPPRRDGGNTRRHPDLFDHGRRLRSSHRS